MKLKVIFASLFIFFLTGCNSEVTKHYPSGSLKSTLSYNSDNKLDGISNYYREDGSHMYTKTYANGKLQGEYIEYRRGEVYVKSNYVKDVLEGEYTKYFNDGTIQVKANYVNNKLDGEYFSYATDGSIKKHQFFKNGVYHGWSTTVMYGKTKRYYYVDGEIDYDKK